ncbi:MAG: DeoR/GlpR family DNA-binding transcription regulator [Eubacteriales bacterium]
MNAIEIANRRNKIVELIKKEKILHTSEAVEIFQVSNETIRKDFNYLESKGILKKIHGGATLSESDMIDPFVVRQTEHYEAKLAIAKKALEFIPKEPCILGLDVGSTVTIFAAQLSHLSGKTIITNSLTALQELIDSNNEVYCTGGKFSSHDMSFQGNIANNTLKDLAMDVSFMGSSGVYNRNGICSTSFQDINVKRELLNRSTKTILLMDSSKFTKSSFVEIANWEEIDTVITDDNIPIEIKHGLMDKVEVILVHVDGLNKNRITID